MKPGVCRVGKGYEMDDQMNDDQFAGDITTAVLNSEWEALSPAQRLCLVRVVDAADGKDALWGHEFSVSFKTIMSKPMMPYLKWQNHQLHVSSDARALVAHAKEYFLFPRWRYLRHWTGSGLQSIMQTRDSALADQLLQQPNWTEINASYFRMLANQLDSAFMGTRKHTNKAEY